MSGMLRNRVAAGRFDDVPAEITPVRAPVFGPHIPILYEDEGQEDMGDTDTHTRSCNILFYGLQFHLAPRPRFRVFANLNLHYYRRPSSAYVSPDIMVVEPLPSCPRHPSSYRVGRHGPAPRLVVEVLSERSYQQGDLRRKLPAYAALRVGEYIVDVTGQFLAQRILLKRLQQDGTRVDEQDPDGGVTSRLGFRVVIEEDGQLRVIDTESGKRYGRPEEAQEALDQLRALEKELVRVRKAAREAKKGKKGRRKS